MEGIDAIEKEATKPLAADALEERNEQIDILSAMEERGFQDAAGVSGRTVRMLVPPGDTRVIGEAGQRPTR